MLVCQTKASTVPYDLACAALANNRLETTFHHLIAAVGSGVHAVANLKNSTVALLRGDFRGVSEALIETVLATLNLVTTLLFTLVSIISPKAAIYCTGDREMAEGPLFTEEFGRVAQIMDARGQLNERYLYIDVDQVEEVSADFKIPRKRRGIAQVIKCNLSQSRDLIEGQMPHFYDPRIRQVELPLEGSKGSLGLGDVKPSVEAHLEPTDGDRRNLALLITSLMTRTRQRSTAQTHSLHHLPTRDGEKAPLVADPADSMGERRVESRAKIADFEVTKGVGLSGTITREISFKEKRFIILKF